MAKNKKYFRRFDPPPTPVTNWQSVPTLFDIPMAARLLGKTAEAVRLLIVSGELPARKVGKEWRLRKDEIMRLMGYAQWEIERFGYGMPTPREETIITLPSA